MSTKLEYLFSNVLTCPARVVELVEADVPVVRLDRTLFHPKTASQRADRGYIGESRVLHVEFNNGTIDHYLDHAHNLRTGALTQISIDENWRKLQSTYHTAGHLLAYAVQAVLPAAHDILGRHWPDAASILFSSSADLKREDRHFISEFVNTHISHSLPIFFTDRNSFRFVQIGSFSPMLCNGTHVENTSEITGFHILQTCFDGDHVTLHYSANCDYANHERFLK